MSQVPFRTPVLIQEASLNEIAHYHIQPLFVNHPVATNMRFDGAIQQFKKNLKQHFRGFVLNNSNKDDLLWYLFNPECQIDIFPAQFSIGSQFIDGLFSFVSFVVKDIQFILLPGFKNYLFIPNDTNGKKQSLKREVLRVIPQLMKIAKKNLGKEFDPAQFMAGKRDFISIVEFNVSIKHQSFEFDAVQEFDFFSKINKSQNFEGAVEIEKVGICLNEKYPDHLKMAYERETLLKRLMPVIFNQKNTAVAIVGEEGIGKHSIVEELLRRHIRDHVKTKKNRRRKMWTVDPNRVISGMSIIGYWQKRLESIIGFLTNHKGTSDIMLVDNVVALFSIGKSSQNNLTMGHVIKPFIEKRKLSLVVIATPDEWKIIQEKDRRFADLFQVVRIQEPDFESAVKMILKQGKILENQFSCELSIQAVIQLFNLQRNYLRRKPLPGSVMKMITQLVAKHKGGLIDIPEVWESFQMFSGLNDRIFDTNYTFEKDEVREGISYQLIGQQEATDALSDVIHSIKARLTNPDKPLGSFLFIGPTGVGKTEAAKVLCRYLLKDGESQLMRFDMNEYIDEYAIHRLIGDYNNPEGQLTGKVRYQPFGIILFDEIEKAHPKVHDLLLQVLDDGRLTDSMGRTVDFSNTIIVMTSNVGASEVSSQLGFETAKVDHNAIYRKALENRFRPEFINRIDRVVIFNSLSFDHILLITRLQIDELLKRDGFVRRTTITNVSSEALEWVAKRGFDAKMGGRALKRQIEKDLTVLSAEQLIARHIDTPIILDIILKNGRLFPLINPLDYIAPLEGSWMPKIPEENRGRRFYNQLKNQIENIERELENKFEEAAESRDIIIVNPSSEDGLDWLYYDLKEQLSTLKERIIHLSLGYMDNKFKEDLDIPPLRLKSAGLSSLIIRFSQKIEKKLIQDHNFQQEAIREISDIYNLTSSSFGKIESEFIDNFLNVEFLTLTTKGFLNGQLDVLHLCFNSYVNGHGQAQINFLIQNYIAFFEAIKIHYKWEKNSNSIYIEGYGLQQMLLGETGIHLFYLNYKVPIPIKIFLADQKKAAISMGESKVIRLYEGKRTITDLRTGFTNIYQINPSEFKLFIYGGIVDQHLKKNQNV